MEKLSVVIITLNEEKHLETCLKSVIDVADEVLVLDSFSTDRTKSICLEAGAVFHEHAFDGYISQKNRALKMAKYDLVLSLDGDEAISEDAHRQILSIKNNRTADGYYFKRKNNYCGKWMEFTSMYPDRKLRLFDRRKASWSGYDPHDFVQMRPDSKTEKIEVDLIHWVYSDIKDHRNKAEKFSSIAAQSYFDQKKPSKTTDKFTHSTWRYIDELLLKGGILEGWRGMKFARISAWYVYQKYQKLEKLYAERS